MKLPSGIDWPSVPPSQGPVRRDRKGNWIQVTKNYDYPTGDATPFEQRHLSRIRERFEKDYPVTTNIIAEEVDSKLLPAVRKAYEIEKAETSRFDAARDAAIRANESTDDLVACKRAEIDNRLADLNSSIRDQRKLVEWRLEEAAVAVSAAGEVFDSKKPLLGIEVPSALDAKAAAGKAGIAYHGFDRKPPLHPAVEWTLACALGAFVGISVLNATGFVHLAYLYRDKPFNVAVAVGLGIASVVFGGASAKLSGSLAAQQSALVGRGAWAFAGPVAWIICLASIHSVADSQGIAQSAAHGHSAPSPLAVTVMSFTFGLPYLAFKFCASLRQGRADANEPKVAAIQHDHLAEAKKNWNTPERVKALESAARHAASVANLDSLLAERKKTEEAGKAELRALEDSRAEVPDSYTQGAIDRMEQANETARGVQRQIEDWLLRMLKAANEPAGRKLKPVRFWIWWWRRRFWK